MKFQSRPRECQALRWVPISPRDSRAGERAQQHIVEWVNANGGVAEYELVGYGESCNSDLPVPPRIRVMTAGGARYMRPGDYAVRKDGAWSVVDPAVFNREWVAGGEAA